MATKNTQPAQMSFLASLASMPAFTKADTKQDPTTIARSKFAANADSQVKLMKEGAITGRWFEKKSDKEVVVCFRNINTIMELSGREYTTVGSIDAAVALLAAAKEAAAAGQLDTAFAATARKTPVRKPKL